MIYIRATFVYCERLALKNSKEKSLKCRFSSNWQLNMESSF